METRCVKLDFTTSEYRTMYNALCARRAELTEYVGGGGYGYGGAIETEIAELTHLIDNLTGVTVNA